MRLKSVLAIFATVQVCFGANPSGFIASPSTVTFTASDPDLSPISGPAVTLTWTGSGGTAAKTWTLSVQSTASTLTNCPRTPASAVTVRCASGTVTGTGGTVACGGTVPLSTTSTQIASGNQGQGVQNYTVHLTMTFADSWQYAPSQNACAANLTYFLSMQN